jgi:hypothetical protein
MGRFFVMSLRKPLRARRGRSGAEMGGDACVALEGEGKRAQERDRGDAQHKASPASTASCPTQ